jgi:copper chaperone CopZ
MKTIIMLFLALIGTTAWGQKTETVVIHTSAECGQCEARLEEGLNFTKGVAFAELNLETQDVTIRYNPKKTDVAALKKVINELGYDADDQKAEEVAVSKLPACCKPGGMESKKK